MWQKLKNFEKVQIGALAALAIMKPAVIKNYMLSWKTEDNIIHMCPFEKFNSTMEVSKTSTFTVWENI